MPHDFINFPELRASEMALYYWDSPHKQITEDFKAEVIRVHDGDTITVRWEERDFDFPVRFLETDAPELNQEGGHESQQWLEERILGKEVEIKIDKQNKVEKWGRLLGNIIHNGINMNQASIREGMAKNFTARHEGQVPDLNKMLRLEQWNL